MHHSREHGRRDLILVLVFALATLILAISPTGYERPDQGRSVRCRARVLDVDNANLQKLGVVKKGEQSVVLKILDGPYEGRIVEGLNQLLGQMDRDKIFSPNNVALVVLSLDEKGEIVFVNPQAHYRLGLELALLALFAVLLVAYGGWTGAKALLSFLFTAMVVWKGLVPLLLKGVDPILAGLGITAILCASIIFLVAGPTRKGATACLGALLGVATSGALAVFFTHRFHIQGAVMPFSETLLYSGYQHLDLARILSAAICLSASGAVMDLGMDVAASMDEVVRKKPGITRFEALTSGLTVGRSVVGTMTTTLLLAYSGSSITLLMAFMAQGIPLANMFNLVYVAAEVLRTLVGSFGLVAVAPFTALCGALLLVPGPARARARTAAPAPANAPLEASPVLPTAPVRD